VNTWNGEGSVVSLLEFACRLRYPSGFTLDATFAAEAPVTALVGPSGSGKTSILSIIAGLREPDSGLVKLGERTLLDTMKGIALRPEQRRVGYVFQDHLLFPHLNVRRNLQYGWRRRGAGARVIEFERVVQLLDLGELLERLPHSLSGGQRRRVALGRALLRGPDLLLLDEPLISLDEVLKSQVLNYLEQVVQAWNIPTLLVSHDPDEVLRLAHQVVQVRAGRITGAGPNKPRAQGNSLSADGESGRAGELERNESSGD
jgi:molybdate transport system ATP-binding protein